jgi:hypothetical protein
MAYSGNAIPLFTSKTTTDKNSCSCNAGELRIENSVAKLHMEYPKNTKRKHEKHDNAVYAAPHCWTIIGATHYLRMDMGPVSYSWSQTPANYSLITSQEFNKISSSLTNYIGNINIADQYKIDLKSKLKEYLQSYQSEVLSLSNSHATLKHKATIQGAGWFNGRTIYDGYSNVQLKCVPSTTTDAKNLEAGLRVVLEQDAGNYPILKDPQGKAGTGTTSDMSANAVAEPAQSPTPLPVTEAIKGTETSLELQGVPTK